MEDKILKQLDEIFLLMSKGVFCIEKNPAIRKDL